MTHPNIATGEPCDCTFDWTKFGQPDKLAKVAGKLEDFLMNPKSRPDLQTPEGQAWLKLLQHHQAQIGDKFDPLTPWLTREWKKGRIKHEVPFADMSNLRDPANRQWAETAALGRIHYHDPWRGRDEAEGFHHPIGAGTLSHWADFYGAKHPVRRGLGDIMQHEVIGYRDLADQWTEALQQEAKDQALAGGEVVHTTPDNWTVRKLTTPEELTAEGEAMGHCVGGYHRAVGSGDTLIYSLRDPEGRPHATTEIQPTHWQDPPEDGRPGQIWGRGEGYGDPKDFNAKPVPHKGELVQIQGKSDERPIPEYQARMKDWFQSFPEEDRPNWSNTKGPIDHIGGIVPTAETYNPSEDVVEQGEPTDEYGEGGYGAHGDYGLVQPERQISYPAVIESLLRNRHYNDWYRERHRGESPQEWDPDEVKALYQEALRRREIPELAKAVSAYGESADDSLRDLEDQNLDYGPSYPGEGYEEEPERWDEIAAQARDGEGNPRPWIERQPWDPYSIYHGVGSGQEAFQRHYDTYQDNRDNLYAEHVPSQLANELYKYINPHFGMTPEGQPGYVNEIQPPQQPPQQPGIIAKVASAIPPAPGTAPIPEGNIRLYHYTGADPEQVRQQGLRIQNAKGESYGEPNQIWASGRPPSLDNHNVVEFSVPRDDPRWNIGKYEPYINYSGKGPDDPDFDYGQHLHDRGAHVTFNGDIRPEEIHAIHEPWHSHYRYLMDNYPDPNKVRPDEFDFVDDPDTARGVQEWKNTLWPRLSKVTKLAHPLYIRWAFSPASGEVTLADNNEDPLSVRYHGDLAREINEPNLVHGYAYRLADGWRLTDWQNAPLEDTFIIAQVMRKLAGSGAPNGHPEGSWDFSGDQDFSRLHHTIPS